MRSNPQASGDKKPFDPNIIDIQVLERRGRYERKIILVRHSYRKSGGHLLQGA